MSKDENYPSEAQLLASLIKRSGSIGMNMASVQRSHRFPLHIFVQIENMARMADVSVSTIINQLLSVGLESVKENLTEDEISQITLIKPEQIERPTKSLKVDFVPVEEKFKK
ncbi:MAG TPA: hypothetical protein VIO87_05430 [Methylotenera sp.]